MHVVRPPTGSLSTTLVAQTKSPTSSSDPVSTDNFCKAVASEISVRNIVGDHVRGWVRQIDRTCSLWHRSIKFSNARVVGKKSAQDLTISVEHFVIGLISVSRRRTLWSRASVSSILKLLGLESIEMSTTGVKKMEGEGRVCICCPRRGRWRLQDDHRRFEVHKQALTSDSSRINLSI